MKRVNVHIVIEKLNLYGLKNKTRIDKAMNDFVYEYWNRTELGREMIASDRVSDNDLLFLIPNNVRKMHGLPVTRMSGKGKRKKKNQRRMHILSFRLFELIEDIVERTIVSTWSQNDFFDKFVEVKDLSAGDKHKFEPFTKPKNIFGQGVF